MSKMLEQAIIDAEALKEAALKNAESTILEKYSLEVKEAVDNLLEQPEDEMAADLGEAPAAGPSEGDKEFMEDMPRADIEELEDGLIIRQSDLKSGTVQGHGDHRVIMSLAIAGTQIEDGITIEGADAIAVTYPTFIEDLREIGGQVESR